MTNRTVSGIFDFQASTSQKYVILNTFLAKLEALAIPTEKGILITAPPISPQEGVTYLCNTSIALINNTVPGSFIKYIKPANSVSLALESQVFYATEGMSPAKDWILRNGLWVLKTNPIVYGLDVSLWPDTLILKVTSALNLISPTSQQCIFNGAAAANFPYTLPVGVYQIVNGSTVIIRSLI